MKLIVLVFHTDHCDTKADKIQRNKQQWSEYLDEDFRGVDRRDMNNFAVRTRAQSTCDFFPTLLWKVCVGIRDCVWYEPTRQKHDDASFYTKNNSDFQSVCPNTTPMAKSFASHMISKGSSYFGG